MENKKLSVIVPIYNVEQHLEQCIESILKQTYGDLEIILVDNGSTDSSALICDKFAEEDGRVQVIHKHNGGLISARCAGVDVSTADCITFVDGDDWIAPNMYEELMRIMCGQDVDMVTSGWIMSWQGGYTRAFEDTLIQEGFYGCQGIKDYILPHMLWDFYQRDVSLNPAVWCKIFRRELLVKQYTELRKQDFFNGEDAALTYPYVLDAGNIYVTHEKYYYYRQKEKGQYADCFSSDNFLGELFSLYSYLKQQFEKSVYKDILIKQLDYFYISRVQRRKWGYCDSTLERFAGQFLFPFGKIPRGCRIVLYGAGEVGHHYNRQIICTDYCRLVGWVDLNYEKYEGENVRPVSEMAKMDYDYIVIANEAPNTCIQIRKTLLDMGIDKERIL